MGYVATSKIKDAIKYANEHFRPENKVLRFLYDLFVPTSIEDATDIGIDANPIAFVIPKSKAIRIMYETLRRGGATPQEIRSMERLAENVPQGLYDQIGFLGIYDDEVENAIRRIYGNRVNIDDSVGGFHDKKTILDYGFEPEQGQSKFTRPIFLNPRGIRIGLPNRQGDAGKNVFEILAHETLHEMFSSPHPKAPIYADLLPGTAPYSRTYIRTMRQNPDELQEMFTEGLAHSLENTSGMFRVISRNVMTELNERLARQNMPRFSNLNPASLRFAEQVLGNVNLKKPNIPLPSSEEFYANMFQRALTRDPDRMMAVNTIKRYLNLGPEVDNFLNMVDTWLREEGFRGLQGRR